MRESGQAAASQNKKSESAPHDATILIIDDSKADRTLFKKWLSVSFGGRYHIVEATSVESGLDAFTRCNQQCIILDFFLCDSDGFQLLATLKRRKAASVPVILVTAMHNEIMEDSAKSQNIHTYFNKQLLGRQDLCAAVENALSPAGPHRT